MKKVLLGLGTNLGKKEQNLNHAIDMVKKEIGAVQAISSIYQTPPWGFESKEYFFNQVIAVQTVLTPSELMIAIKKIESTMGRLQREQGQGYQDRIIDLDILDYAGEVMDLEHVTIPHPKMSERSFVLLPLQEVDQFWVHPTSKMSILDLINALKNDIEIKKI